MNMYAIALYDSRDECLRHHGVKGQQWGIRRYQYSDGTLTPAGRRHYAGLDGSKNSISESVKNKIKQVATAVTGKQYSDSVLAKGTTFKRVQSTDKFEKYPFYATYKKDDQDRYLGLFGKNLTKRANGEAVRAEKKAKASGSEEDLEDAVAKRNKAKNLKVYQLSIEATKKLKIPSDDNAGDITAKLLKNDEFKANVKASIADSKQIMKRPAQQVLFNDAQKALSKDVSRLSNNEKKTIYKALNLSLVNHNEQEVAAQNALYSEFKNKGYNALLDYNDKSYSSYHAKRPVIVFDTDSVALTAVIEANPKIVNSLYKKYNAERIRKEITANTIGFVSQSLGVRFKTCANTVQNIADEYLQHSEGENQMDMYGIATCIGDEYLKHHGVKGQKWYVRRYQNEDGTLTEAGKARQAKKEEKAAKKEEKKEEKAAKKEEKKQAKAAAKKAKEEDPRKLLKKQARSLTDEELAQAITRLGLEEKYTQAMEKQNAAAIKAHDKRVERKEKFKDTVTSKAADLTGQGARMLIASLGSKTINSIMGEKIVSKEELLNGKFDEKKDTKTNSNLVGDLSKYTDAAIEKAATRAKNEQQIYNARNKVRNVDDVDLSDLGLDEDVEKELRNRFK